MQDLTKDRDNVAFNTEENESNIVEDFVQTSEEITSNVSENNVQTIDSSAAQEGKPDSSDSKEVLEVNFPFPVDIDCEDCKTYMCLFSIDLDRVYYCNKLLEEEFTASGELEDLSYHLRDMGFKEHLVKLFLNYKTIIAPGYKDKAYIYVECDSKKEESESKK